LRGYTEGRRLPNEGEEVWKIGSNNKKREVARKKLYWGEANVSFGLIQDKMGGRDGEEGSTGGGETLKGNGNEKGKEGELDPRVAWASKGNEGGGSKKRKSEKRCGDVGGRNERLDIASVTLIRGTRSG